MFSVIHKNEEILWLLTDLLGLLQEIWLTLISHVLVVDVVVEKVKANVTESVATFPMSM